MQQIKRRIKFAVIVAFAFVSTAALAQGQVGVSRVQAVSPSGLELTSVDAFANRNWNAKDVRVLGFFLGMSQADADNTAAKQSLALNCLRWCGVCDKGNVLCSGIDLHFDTDGHVDAIAVGRPLEEASQALRKFSVTQKFRGKTYIFFHKYSNALRLELFGPESGRKEDTVRARTYLYPLRGIEIYVNLSTDKNAQENEADLSVTFTLPKQP
ncbi:MAG TPA: hypothetical protein VKP58_16555 [Candidatus Acidoferrum sp.]|nr:hypothetical protein [Candidatus Acidoferrum sp.]